MGFFKRITSGYEELWKSLVRPPRDPYSVDELGPKTFVLGQRVFQRTDLTIVNQRGLRLACSFFEPDDTQRAAQYLPCVIYLHGNSSSRLESIQAVSVLLPANISVFSFDFGGSGHSDGEYISLGWYERDDLSIIIQYLRNCDRVSTIGLWGRSMGAGTALMHAYRDHSIAGLVLDSAFSDLAIAAKEIAQSHTSAPSFLLNMVLSSIRKTIMKKANFDLAQIKPMNHTQCFIPALFATGTNDTFILPHHTQDLYEAYAGDKQAVFFEGNHHGNRPEEFLNAVVIFFFNVLQADTIETPPELAPKVPESKVVSHLQVKQPN